MNLRQKKGTDLAVMKRTNNKAERSSLMSANLPPISSYDTEQAIRLLQELSKWNPSPKAVKALQEDDFSPKAAKAAKALQEDNFNAALEAIHQAIRETKRYLKRRREGEDRDGVTEDRLSNLWFDAGSKILPYEGYLSSLCYVKGNGWADEATWKAKEFRNLPTSVDQMLQRVGKLGENPPPKDLPRWVPIAGVLFLAFAVLSLFYLLLAPQGISPDKHVIFDVWIGFCSAASASFLGGTAKADGRLPWPAWLGGSSSPIQFATAGGIAVFIIVLVILLNAYH
jgi:hypothetical protein